MSKKEKKLSPETARLLLTIMLETEIPVLTHQLPIWQDITNSVDDTKLHTALSDFCTNMALFIEELDSIKLLLQKLDSLAAATMRKLPCGEICNLPKAACTTCAHRPPPTDSERKAAHHAQAEEEQRKDEEAAGDYERGL